MEPTIESTTTTEQPMTAAGLAAELGEDASRVGLQAVNWSVYAQEGVLVKVSIGLCNWVNKMGLADWGIVTESEEEKAVYERTCAFGSRYILPKDVIDPIVAIGGRGRSAVERYALPTTWGHFVPKKLYAAWRAENDALRAEFFKGMQDLADNWDAYVAQMDADYMTVARRNYRALVAQGVKLEGSPEEYAAVALARSKRRIQSKEAALAAFRWEWTTTGLPFDPEAEGGFQRAMARGDLVQADLYRTAAQQEAGGLQTLIADLTGQIRGRVYEVVVDVLSALRKNGGKLPPASTGQLRKLIETVEQMMFWPDAELTERLATVRELVGATGEARSNEQIQAVVTGLGVEMRSYLLSIDRPPKRSAAEFGIPDDRRGLAAARRRKAITAPIIAAPRCDDTPDAPARRGRKSRASAPIEVDAAPVILAPADLPTIEDATTELVLAAV